MRNTWLRSEFYPTIMGSNPFLQTVLTGDPQHVQAALNNPKTNLLEGWGERHVGVFAFLAPRLQGVGPGGQETDPADMEVLHTLISHPGIAIGGDSGDSVGLPPLDIMEQNKSPYREPVVQMLLRRDAIISLPMKTEIGTALLNACGAIFDVNVKGSESEIARGERLKRITNDLYFMQKTARLWDPDLTEKCLLQATKQLQAEDERIEDACKHIGLTLLESFPEAYTSLFPAGVRGDLDIDPAPFNAAKEIAGRPISGVRSFAAYFVADQLFLRALRTELGKNDLSMNGGRDRFNTRLLYAAGNAAIRETLGVKMKLPMQTKDGYFRPFPI